MQSLKRRPRRWHLSSRALVAFLAVPALASTTFDGLNIREIATLGVVLACGFAVAYRADHLQSELDHLERRLHVPAGKRH